MANWAKKIEAFKGNELTSVETIEAAAFLQPFGTVSNAAVYGGIGGLLGMFVGKKMQDKKLSKEEMTKNGLAKDLVVGPTIVGVTNSGRVMVYEQSALSGKPKSFKRAFDKKDITSAVFEKGKMAHKLSLTFSDGDRASFDYPRGQKTEDFMSIIGG